MNENTRTALASRCGIGYLQPERYRWSGGIRRALMDGKRRDEPRRRKARLTGRGVGVQMIRENMDDIAQVAFPEGFGVRDMRTEDASLWTDIHWDAEPFIAKPFMEINEELFFREFGDDAAEIKQRLFFVVTDKGVAVGTVGAWYSRDFKGADYGRIHWIAVRPAYQGLGLGKAALSCAMNRLAKWHRRCYLTTQTGRIPAIRMYLDFGFLPDLDPDGAADAWRGVREKLDHPVLSGLL